MLYTSKNGAGKTSFVIESHYLMGVYQSIWWLKWDRLHDVYLPTSESQFPLLSQWTMSRSAPKEKFSFLWGGGGGYFSWHFHTFCGCHRSLMHSHCFWICTFTHTFIEDPFLTKCQQHQWSLWLCTAEMTVFSVLSVMGVSLVGILNETLFH